MKTTIILTALVMSFSMQGASAKELQKPEKVQKPQIESLYSGIEGRCYDGMSFHYKSKAGLTSEQLGSIADKKCFKHCNKITKKCGVNSSHIFGFLGLYDLTPTYRKIAYTCRNVKTIFKAEDKNCRTRAVWKQKAYGHCAKILRGARFKQKLLNGYKVSNLCKPKRVNNFLQQHKPREIRVITE